MNKKTQQIVDSIKEMLRSRGYTEDSHGHFKKSTNSGELYRYKFQATSLRKESQVRHSDGTKSWVRLSGNYYSKLSISEDNKICGMKRNF
jgi:hypothetical protein